MTIELLSEKEYDTLKGYYTNYPKLTFQNNGYEYINKSSLNEEELNTIKNIERILKDHIKGFVKFFNFCLSKDGEITLRFDYQYDERFTGVGYILLDELLNGFNN